MDSEGEEIDADELEALKAEASADLVELKKEADEAAATSGEGRALRAHLGLRHNEGAVALVLRRRAR